MLYKIVPFGELWMNGAFSVPNAIVDNYIKMASEYQIKALLILFRNGGTASADVISKSLGITEKDVENLMQFWCEEGFIQGENGEYTEAPKTQQPSKTVMVKKEEQKPQPKKEKKAEKVIEVLPAPNLTPKDIVEIMRKDSKIVGLLTEAENVLGRSISHAEKVTIINMVNYYGLSPEVVLTIFQYYRQEKEKGRAITVSYIVKMGKNWAEDGIETLNDAEEKLKSISESDKTWNEILALLDLRYRRPTAAQRKIISGWKNDISFEMIELACEETKENAENPSFKYMQTIVDSWIKKGIKTPADFNKDKEDFKTKKASKSKGKLQSKPTYDLEKIKKDAMNNTEIKF